MCLKHSLAEMYPTCSRTFHPPSCRRPENVSSTTPGSGPRFSISKKTLHPKAWQGANLISSLRRMCFTRPAILADTLRRVHALAAPGGLLVLLEVTAPQRWVDITFGLTEGWWKFTDRERRRDYPLLSSEQWKRLLAETGFPEALAVPAPDHPVPYPTLHLEAVIVARRDSASPSESMRPEAGASEHQNWLVLADNDGFGLQVLRPAERKKHPHVARDSRPSLSGGTAGGPRLDI